MSTGNLAVRALFLLGVGLASLGCGGQAQKPIEPENDSAETPDPVVVDEVAVAEASPRMKAALQETRRRFDRSGGNPRAFVDSLRNVWDELPLVRVTTGDPTGAWTKVRLNAHGAGFDAVRFKNPLSRPEEVIVVLALPGNPSFFAGVAANRSGVQPKGTLKSFRKANLLLDDLDLPDRNEVYFFKLDKGVFHPANECCLWFAFLDPGPIDVYLMPRLVESVPGEQEPLASAADIAQKLGFELPFRYTKAATADRPGQAPSGMNQALEKALELIVAGEDGTPEFAQTLESVKSGFEEIPAAVGDQDPGWTTVRLDAANLGLDAVRFSNPTDEPAGMIWAFALPEDVRVSWYIASATAPGSPGFRNFQSKACLDIPGLDLPKRNKVFFQQLGSGRIHPGHDYFLWFRLQTNDPVDIHVKLRLLDPEEETLSPYATAEPLAERLGLELPFRFTDAVTLMQRAQDVAGSRGPDALLEFLEKELENVSDREAELYYVGAAQQYGLMLAVNDETRDQAVAYYFKAAKMMRRRRQSQEQLDPQEQHLLRAALYNEACGLALTGQPEKAAESLREAIQAGYLDLTHILADDDLREVRALPVFDELVQEVDDARRAARK